jgi:hypothetical protein
MPLIYALPCRKPPVRIERTRLAMSIDLTYICLIVFDQFERPFAKMSVVVVHLKEILGEKHRLLSTDAGSDLELGIIMISRCLRQDFVENLQASIEPRKHTAWTYFVVNRIQLAAQSTQFISRHLANLIVVGRF